MKRRWLRALVGGVIVVGFSGRATAGEFDRPYPPVMPMGYMAGQPAQMGYMPAAAAQMGYMAGAPAQMGYMPMAGSPMFASIDVKRTDVAGRYEADGDFSMAGTWRITLQWEGPAGQGSVSFPGSVQ